MKRRRSRQKRAEVVTSPKLGKECWQDVQLKQTFFAVQPKFCGVGGVFAAISNRRIASRPSAPKQRHAQLAKGSPQEQNEHTLEEG